MNRLMFTEQPEQRAMTESSEIQNLDSKLTDMLVKENRQLKKLLEARSEDMSALVEKA